MKDCLLISLVDAALSHEGLDEYLYSALQAASDTMPKQTVEHVADQYARLLAEIAKMQEPPDEDQLTMFHPTFCEGCEE